MTSARVSATIDADFPVAGVDNDSQGFRDNFSIIRDGLATANAEITELQTNTAKLNDDNDFNGNVIANAVTNQLYGIISLLSIYIRRFNGCTCSTISKVPQISS